MYLFFVVLHLFQLYKLIENNRKNAEIRRQLQQTRYLRPKYLLVEHEEEIEYYTQEHQEEDRYRDQLDKRETGYPKGTLADLEAEWEKKAILKAMKYGIMPSTIGQITTPFALVTYRLPPNLDSLYDKVKSSSEAPKNNGPVWTTEEAATKVNKCDQTNTYNYITTPKSKIELEVSKTREKKKEVNLGFNIQDRSAETTSKRSEETLGLKNINSREMPTNAPKNERTINVQEYSPEKHEIPIPNGDVNLHHSYNDGQSSLHPKQPVDTVPYDESNPKRLENSHPRDTTSDKKENFANVPTSLNHKTFSNTGSQIHTQNSFNNNSMVLKLSFKIVPAKKDATDSTSKEEVKCTLPTITDEPMLKDFKIRGNVSSSSPQRPSWSSRKNSHKNSNFNLRTDRTKSIHQTSTDALNVHSTHSLAKSFRVITTTENNKVEEQEEINPETIKIKPQTMNKQQNSNKDTQISHKPRPQEKQTNKEKELDTEEETKSSLSILLKSIPKGISESREYDNTRNAEKHEIHEQDQKVTDGPNLIKSQQPNSSEPIHFDKRGSREGGKEMVKLLKKETNVNHTKNDGEIHKDKGEGGELLPPKSRTKLFDELINTQKQIDKVNEQEEKSKCVPIDCHDKIGKHRDLPKDSQKTKLLEAALSYLEEGMDVPEELKKLIAPKGRGDGPSEGEYNNDKEEASTIKKTTTLFHSRTHGTPRLTASTVTQTEAISQLTTARARQSTSMNIPWHNFPPIRVDDRETHQGFDGDEKPSFNPYWINPRYQPTDIVQKSTDENTVKNLPRIGTNGQGYYVTNHEYQEHATTDRAENNKINKDRTVNQNRRVTTKQATSNKSRRPMQALDNNNRNAIKNGKSPLSSFASKHEADRTSTTQRSNTPKRQSKIRKCDEHRKPIVVDVIERSNFIPISDNRYVHIPEPTPKEEE